MKAARTSTTYRRVNVSLPEETLGLLKRVVPRSPYSSRSRFIDAAVRELARTVGTARFRKRLEAGYRRNAEHDLRLVEEWFAVDEEAWPDDERPKK